MHGLIFETSICYWQDQPGIYRDVRTARRQTAADRPHARSVFLTKNSRSRSDACCRAGRARTLSTHRRQCHIFSLHLARASPSTHRAHSARGLAQDGHLCQASRTARLLRAARAKRDLLACRRLVQFYTSCRNTQPTVSAECAAAGTPSLLSRATRTHRPYPSTRPPCCRCMLLPERSALACAWTRRLATRAAPHLSCCAVLCRVLFVASIKMPAVFAIRRPLLADTPSPFAHTYVRRPPPSHALLSAVRQLASMVSWAWVWLVV